MFDNEMLISHAVLIGALIRWIPRLPRLTQLEPWCLAALQGNGNLVRLHCPLFKRLHLWDSPSSVRSSSVSLHFSFVLTLISHRNEVDPDQCLAAFLKDLRPQSLESFKSFNHRHLEPAFLQALSCHGESLTELNLTTFRVGAKFPNFSLLKGCTNLVSFSLAGDGRYYMELEMTRHRGLCEMICWLKDCKKLRNLAITSFISPSWISPVLSEISIHLTSFKCQGFYMRDTGTLHRALANQTSLQSLWLEGDMDDSSVDTDALVISLSKLNNLTDLHLEDIADLFVDRHIVKLAHSLQKLEVWSTDGSMFTDAIWSAAASLKSLRRLNIAALTSFTTTGIIGFIEKLGPGNKGLVLSVLNADKESRVERELIQRKIAKMVQGKFESPSRSPM